MDVIPEVEETDNEDGERHTLVTNVELVTRQINQEPPPGIQSQYKNKKRIMVRVPWTHVLMERVEKMRISILQ